MLVFNFNPRTRAGCDNDDTHQGVGRINFNPRTRAGCDVLVWVTVSNKRLFQSTHPCRVRLMQRPYKWSYYRFQSTHPCRVRHCYPFGRYSGAEISIHAPVQGATFEHSFFQLSSIISIHAPVQGATKLTCRLPYEYDFNPRTRAGCDNPPLVHSRQALAFQSTHPCRVRRDTRTVNHSGRKFQSTHPCRVRQPTFTGVTLSDTFQSTHPCRVRQIVIQGTNYTG